MTMSIIEDLSPMLKSGMSLGKRLTISFTVIIAFMVKDRYPKTNIANRVMAYSGEIFCGFGKAQQPHT